MCFAVLRSKYKWKWTLIASFCDLTLTKHKNREKDDEAMDKRKED